MFSDVSWVDCMEALAALQLTTDCVARMFVNKQQLAEHVIVMTKALSEAHFRYDTTVLMHCGQCVYIPVICCYVHMFEDSLVPSPIPNFSMLHTTCNMGMGLWG